MAARAPRGAGAAGAAGVGRHAAAHRDGRPRPGAAVAGERAGRAGSAAGGRCSATRVRRSRPADPHALDDGTRLAAVVLRAGAVTLRAEPPTAAEQRRASRERVGGAEGELSATVLGAAPRPAGEDPLARAPRAC